MARKRTRCQVCDMEFGKVQASEFVENQILRAADVAQVCIECAKNIPAAVVIDLRARPQFFADNKKKHKRYHDPRKWMGKLDFGDKIVVVKEDPGIDLRAGSLRSE